MSDWPKDYDLDDRQSPWVECPDCDGEGWIGAYIEDRDMCPKCRGTGEVPSPELSQWEQDCLWEKRNRY